MKVHMRDLGEAVHLYKHTYVFVEAFPREKGMFEISQSYEKTVLIAKRVHGEFTF